jgi:hypothetical protein
MALFLTLISFYPRCLAFKRVAQNLHSASKLGIFGLESLDRDLHRAILTHPLGIQLVTQRLRNLTHLVNFRRETAGYVLHGFVSGSMRQLQGFAQRLYGRFELANLVGLRSDGRLDLSLFLATTGFELLPHGGNGFAQSLEFTALRQLRLFSLFHFVRLLMRA